MRTLVINLTRFGDLLQSQPVMAGLKAQGHEVGLVCLENFLPAVELLPAVDAVYPLPGHRLLAGLDRDWRHGLGLLWRWCVQEAGNFGAQRLVNLTSTLPARLLVRMLAPAKAQAGGLGFYLDAYGFGVNSSPWASFLVASTSRRGCSPFNLVDLFCQVAEVGASGRGFQLAGPGPKAARAVEAMLAQASPPGARGLAALQLGASHDARRWPVANFARLGDMLWQDLGLCPVLLGSSGEVPLGQRFRDLAACPSLDLMGRTSLPELAAALERCDILVTNDTGTMHLAAGLGRPVCALFLATAQAWDTGPYLAGALCLEPDLDCHPCGFSARCGQDHACRGRIEPGEVFGYVARRLKTGSWGRHEGPKPAQARAWESRPDADGFMDLVSLTGHEHDDRTRWVRMQRWFYRQFLDRGPLEPWAFGPHGLGPEAEAEAARVLHAAERQLTLLIEQARVLARRPMPAMKAKFMGTWQRLQALWAESPAFNVLGLLWAEQSQEAAGDLAGMTALAERYLALVSAWGQSFQETGGTEIV